MTGGCRPTADVVASVLRRWSFRYSKGTVTRRARDFCTPFGRVIDQAANPKESKLVVHSAWLEPRDLLAVDGVADDLAGPAAHAGRGQPAFEEYFAGRGDRRQLRLPLKEDA